MIAHHRQSLGQRGEIIAADYLQKQGYLVLERNCRTPYGEIDLVTSKDNVIVFVEVKTRASRALGPPEISITSRKAEHMRSAAEYYIQQRPELLNDYRIDVICILYQPKIAIPAIDHFENVIS